METVFKTQFHDPGTIAQRSTSIEKRDGDAQCDRPEFRKARAQKITRVPRRIELSEISNDFAANEAGDNELDFG
jgi:hypothetical protein